MAVSSNFSTTNDKIKYRIEATTNSQNISNNTSNVTVKVFCWRTNTGYTTYGSGTVYCYINGTTYSASITSSHKITSSGIYLFSKTLDIPHNTDGKKTLSTSAYIDHSQFSSNSNSASFVLTTIPRASGVTCNSFYIGDSTTINISRASSTFTHTIKYVYGNLSGTLATKTSETSLGWTPPTTFYSQIPNGTTGYGSIVCETYSGDTLIGTSTANFNAYAKQSDCIPDITSRIRETNESVMLLTGDDITIVKYLSKPKVTMTATPRNSATIKETYINWGGETSVPANEYTFLNGVTSPNVDIVATDSRGYTTIQKYDLIANNLWVEYVKLAFSRITITRTESTSSKVNLKVSGNYFNGSFGSVQNEFTLKYRYKVEGGTYTDYITVDPPRTNDTFDYSETLNNIDFKQQYVFEFVLEDKAMVVTSGEKVLEKGEGIFRIGHDYTKTNGKILDNYGTELTNGLSKYRTGGIDIDPNTTLEELILTETNTPTGGFWYIKTMFYANKTATSNRTQVAYPYAYSSATVRPSTYVRTYVTDVGWSNWQASDIKTFSKADGSGAVHFASGLLIQWGRVDITPAGANTVTSATVTFPIAYDMIPNVMAIPNTSVPNVLTTGVGGGTTTETSKKSMVVYMTRTNTITTTFQWFAIGYKAI